MSDSLVIIPTYNEAENVARMIHAVHALPQPFHILIIDDGSPDGTAAIVKSLQRAYPSSLFLIERAGKQGLGTAYITGFRWGLARGYNYLFEMDCDFSHDPRDLLRLRQVVATGLADVAIGSRYVRGGKLVNWPADRIMLSKGASLYVRLFTGMPIKDPTAGFICYRRAVLEALDLDKIRFIGYAFQIEMKFAARQLGFRLLEIPITFTDRVEGQSKMSKGIVKEAIRGVLEMRLRAWFRSYRKAADVSAGTAVSPGSVENR